MFEVSNNAAPSLFNFRPLVFVLQELLLIICVIETIDCLMPNTTSFAFWKSWLIIILCITAACVLSAAFPGVCCPSALPLAGTFKNTSPAVRLGHLVEGLTAPERLVSKWRAVVFFFFFSCRCLKAGEAVWTYLSQHYSSKPVVLSQLILSICGVSAPRCTRGQTAATAQNTADGFWWILLIFSQEPPLH